VNRTSSVVEIPPFSAGLGPEGGTFTDGQQPSSKSEAWQLDDPCETFGLKKSTSARQATVGPRPQTASPWPTLTSTFRAAATAKSARHRHFEEIPENPTA
jgi:hypothetical protein